MKIVLLLTCILIGLNGYCQQSSSLIDSLNYWLHTGQYSADILALKPNKKAERIGKIIQDSVSTKPEWFRNFSNKVNKNSDFPYHKNLGVSPKEYADFLLLRNKKQYGPKGIAKIEIRNEESTIKFASVGFLIGVRYLTINKSTGAAIVAPPKLPIAHLKEVIILKSEDSDNEFNSPYTGFKWNQVVTEGDSLQKIFYEVVLLHLDASDNVFFQITVKSANNGQFKTTNIVPFSFKRNGVLPVVVKERKKLEPKRE